MDYYFAFSWKGLLVFLLPMIPNIFYFLYPKLSASGSTANRHLILDIIEHGSQAIFILLLVVLISKKNSPILSSYTIFIAILLLSYYAFWIIYFTGNKNLTILLGMAVLPVVYFILAEIWLHNFPAIIPTVFFGTAHIIITYMDYH